LRVEYVEKKTREKKELITDESRGCGYGEA